MSITAVTITTPRPLLDSSCWTEFLDAGLTIEDITAMVMTETARRCRDIDIDIDWTDDDVDVDDVDYDSRVLHILDDVRECNGWEPVYTEPCRHCGTEVHWTHGLGAGRQENIPTDIAGHICCVACMGDDGEGSLEELATEYSTRVGTSQRVRP